MITLLVVPFVIVMVIGLGVVVWSIIDTRKRYYKDYLEGRNRSGRD